MDILIISALVVLILCFALGFFILRLILKEERKTIGTLNILFDEDGEKYLFLELDSDGEELVQKDIVHFRVKRTINKSSNEKGRWY